MFVDNLEAAPIALLPAREHASVAKMSFADTWSNSKAGLF